MATTLIHQPLLAAEDELSPFDRAIREIAADGQELLLAAPYISWRYLAAVTGLTKSWRLLADVDAWLENETLPSEAVVFIREHLHLVHHCQDLHAKVVVSRTRALVGSANLTRKGLTGRQEVGVLLDDIPVLEQLHAWFEGLWRATLPPQQEELHRVLRAIPPRTPPTEPKVKLSTPYKGVRTRLLTSMPSPVVKPASSPGKPGRGAPLAKENAGGKMPPEVPDEHLIKRLRLLAKSREDASAFLELLARPLHVHGLTPDDARVSVSAPRTERELNLHFNDWQVASWKEGGRLSLLVEALPFPELPIKYASREVSLRGPFHWQRFPWTSTTPLPERVVSSWQKAFGEALQQGEKSLHRRWHCPLLAAALLDKAAREVLLDRAFPLPQTESLSDSDPDEEDALARICRKMPSPDFSHTFFDLVALFLDLSGLSGDDPRLACTIRQDGSRLTVQVGSRYVLTAKMVGHYGGHYGMIAPSRFESQAHIFPEVLRFNAREFARVGDEPEGMGYLSVRLACAKDLPEGLRLAWQQGIHHEMSRKIPSPQRQRHRPVVLRAARDAAVRARVLRLAFPAGFEPALRLRARARG